MSKGMKLIMETFRSFIKEDYDLDANDDGQLSQDDLRRMVDELEGEDDGPGKKSDAQLQDLIDEVTASLRTSGTHISRTGFYPSVMYRILRTGNIDGSPGNEENGVEEAIRYLESNLRTKEDEPAAPIALSVVPQLKATLHSIKKTIESEGGVTPNFEPTTFGQKQNDRALRDNGTPAQNT